MNYSIAILLITGILISCGKPNPEEQKNKLQGYWEITSVEMPNGKKKEFDINTVIDYIEINGDSGTRTKVFPKFDGSFTTNEVSEKFKLKIEDDSLRMYYKTPFDLWKETVVEAQDSSLTVKNRDNKTYTYSKFKKFDFKTDN